MPDSPTDRRTILIVHDGFLARECLAMMLRRRGFNPVAAQCGSIALAHLGSWVEPDVIVLDTPAPD